MTDNFETLSKILVHDTSRNKLILNDVQTELNQGKKAVIITERKEHIETLNLFLKQSYETITLSGNDTDSSMKAKWKTLKESNFHVLITTGQYFGEGADLHNINTLFLVYPFSFQGKLIQYIGRVQRSGINPIIYDYRDMKIDYLNKLFLKRNTYYRKIDKQATFFDEPQEEIAISKSKTITIEKQVKIPIADLEFRYGNVTFLYTDKPTNKTLEFEIENIELRPEFDVLKPYFIKVLKSKTIYVELFAEFENGKIVSQLATSQDIERINKEVVENVKLQFLNKGLIGQIPISKQNIITSEELQNNQNIYTNAENILADFLKNKSYKHSQHIQFLADNHESNTMKIRFVLQPFSFVFLLSGEHQYHIVLETLDTEEATYIWHTAKDRQMLIETVKHIDLQLNIIRDKGRETFLKTNPENFTRIMHNYLDENKGFIVWKNLLEKRLT
ncbi:MAG: DEAD/DEAH box helicase [Bacteroidales bacterium]